MSKKKAASGSASNNTAANLGFEAKFWLTAFNDSEWFRKDDDVRSQKAEQHICNL